MGVNMNTDIKKWCFIGSISSLIYCISSVSIYGHLAYEGLFDIAAIAKWILVVISLIIYISYFRYSLHKKNQLKYLVFDIFFGIIGIIAFNAMVLFLIKVNYFKLEHNEMPGNFHLSFNLFLGLELFKYVFINNLLFIFMLRRRIITTNRRLDSREHDIAEIKVIRSTEVLAPMSIIAFIVIIIIWIKSGLL